MLELMLLEPWLRRTRAAWPPDYPAGVALWWPDGHRGFAATLAAEDERALSRQGYRIRDHRPLGAR